MINPLPVVIMYLVDKPLMTFTGPDSLTWCTHWVTVMAHYGIIANCVISYSL